ncbi:MAG: hypothetical protein OXJ90_25145, partial [Spirochaetaceae bacterium]|nr:hypothetical protein [Spirochaetaceae bacterium]
MTCRGDSARPDHRSPFGRPGWILSSEARRAAWGRGVLALSLLGLALALWGGFGAQAAAQAPAAQLESSVVSEGETAVLRI